MGSNVPPCLARLEDRSHQAGLLGLEDSSAAGNPDHRPALDTPSAADTVRHTGLVLDTRKTVGLDRIAVVVAAEGIVDMVAGCRRSSPEGNRPDIDYHDVGRGLVAAGSLGHSPGSDFGNIRRIGLG